MSVAVQNAVHSLSVKSIGREELQENIDVVCSEEAFWRIARARDAVVPQLGQRAGLKAPEESCRERSRGSEAHENSNEPGEANMRSAHDS